MTRRCSHCGHNGHNSRTCPDRSGGAPAQDRGGGGGGGGAGGGSGGSGGGGGGVKLFGVRIATESATAANMRKSASMGNLTHYPSNPPSTPEHSESGTAADGYVSDGLVQTSSNARERKKGVPWTEEEHRLFLLGLKKLGKGDWRGISRNYVQTRTPTQVASHAQKYFIRQTNLNKRKRRSSLFDIVSETGPRPMAEDTPAKSPESTVHGLNQASGGAGLYSQGAFYEHAMPRRSEIFTPMMPIAGVPPRGFSVMPHLQQAIPLPVIPAALGPASAAGEQQQAEGVGSYGGEVTVLSRPVAIPAAGATAVVSGSGTQAVPPVAIGAQFGYHPFPVWSMPPPAYRPVASPSKVVKPTACPAKIDEGSEMAKLTLGPSASSAESSSLTLKLLEKNPSRSSAFQLKAPFNNSSLGPSTISVV